MLIEIRQELGLTLTDLSVVLGVARPTVYSWLNGTEPEQESLEKIRMLQRLAAEVREKQIPRFEYFLQRPLFDDRTLVEKLRDNDLTDPEKRWIFETAQLEEQTRQASPTSYTGLKPQGDDPSQPIYLAC